MIKVTNVYEPKPENAQVYKDLYEIYVSAYEGLAEHGTYEKVAALQNKLGL